MLAELRGAFSGEVQHVFFAAEVQAAGGASFDAGRFEALADAVIAQGAFEHAFCFGIEFRNIERAARDAVPAADTFILLKIVDAITGLRVSEENENEGLDIALHGEEAYNLEA